MASWPETLPAAPLADSYRETPGEQAVRTQMESGSAKMRRRTTAAPSKIEMAFMMSDGQVGVLEQFFAQDLYGGSLSFDFTHPRTGSAVVCRFLRPPALVSQNGLYYRVVVEAEILP